MFKRVAIMAIAAGLFWGTFFPCMAAEKLQFGLAYRYGTSAIRDRETFHLHEVIAFHTLPWDWRWEGGWYLNTIWEIHFGLLGAAGEERVFFSTGPRLELDTPLERFRLVAAFRPAFLEDHVFGKENLGGSIQFTEEVGLDFVVLKSLIVGYRFQHISNANIYSHNPGVDLHVFEIRWLLP